MNTNKHIAIIGGDARYLEMIKELSTSTNAKISLVGFDQLKEGFVGAHQVDFDDLEPEDLDAIILPVPGSDGNGFVETVFTDKDIQITSNWLKKLPTHCLVFTGITTNYLNKTVIEEANLTLIPLFNRDDVAIYNSIPTVEGTIMMAIQNTDFTIHSSDVIVLGLGRVGMSVASKFSALGAHVSVGARDKADIARIKEMGLTPFEIQDLDHHVDACDILINTIPALVVTESAIQQMKSHTLIIDLASKPGGTDFDYAKKRGIKALMAPGLPGIVAPKTAGGILGSVISQLVKEHFQERGM
ncbi:dipicolinic acid synthetase subunit A [Aquibacillus sp. 3ASR75-11]|uniref:Dipicolinic acid synthetase subunit A n=1 Tax=Terrihalobacillus insolitus TaxID=2950438 RepID=A0A9X3WSN7_9BACI|nr:dipicolinic acid synthetase subunit A [Terrihalobacillus insolitus]MDC3414090.1 dipicolinic acid synthetase subunit A [Terrihalobacillus insolitus]MDC3423531.1 dipicolinic acid synthetase subunit A [Terrihalobacillus insolitus]